MTDAVVYGDAAIVGALSGFRSMAGPALVTRAANSGLLLPKLGKTFLNHRSTVNGSLILALGELVVDKLPSTPSRLSVGPLLARALAGGYSGGVLSNSRKRPVVIGAAIGAAAAIGGAYAGYHLRRFLHKKIHLPSVLAGVAEDAILAGAIALAVRKLRSEY